MAFSGLAVAVLLLSLASHARPCAEQEKGSLLQFLVGLSRDSGLAVSWRNGTADCCSWEGITCNGNGEVVEVSLGNRGLEGRISPALGDLAGLLRLNLSHNSLSGGLPLEQLMSSSSIVAIDVSFNRLEGELHELPSSVSHGRPLQVLNISSNMFTGGFLSSTWKLMKNLVTLNASNNSFSGQVPSSFCLASASFAVLDLQHNKFSGNIPPALGNCSMLKVLMVGHNNLSGTIPGELFNVTSLERLSFRNTGLQGKLDGANIAKLSNLVTLDLGGNKLSGKIPDSIGQLKRLEQLHMDSNNMYGELPAALGNCINLITINLKVNSFTGDLGKVNFSTMLNLQILDLYMNNFTGTIPESIYSCSNLTVLRLSANSFHGKLSTRIGNLNYLSFLSLGNNSFTNITSALQILKGCRNLATLLMGHNFRGEVMPQDKTIDGFENLQLLDIERCSLSGEIPLWLSKLTNLMMLVLRENRLTGPIPSWMNSLSRLFYLDVSSNCLIGEIPIALMEMPMIKSFDTAACLYPRHIGLSIYKDPSHQYGALTAFPKALKLGNNNFTGAIPLEIGELKALAVLNLSSNTLSGEIPQSLCNLTSLQLLDLSSNHLMGAIPASLNNLHFLSAFNVSANDLEGPIPTGGQFDTFDNSSYAGNPQLCGPMLGHNCDSAVAVPVSRLSVDQCSYEVTFAIGFSVFFGVGMLLDQMVLSRLMIT